MQYSFSRRNDYLISFLKDNELSEFINTVLSYFFILKKEVSDTVKDIDDMNIIKEKLDCKHASHLIDSTKLFFFTTEEFDKIIKILSNKLAQDMYKVEYFRSTVLELTKINVLALVNTLLNKDNIDE